MPSKRISIPHRLEDLTGFTPALADLPIKDIQQSLGLDHVVKLSFNENPKGPSPHAVASASEAIRHTNRYPAGPGSDLRATISRHEGLTPEQVILSNGADDMIGLVAQLLDPGEEALIPSPTFGQYSVAVKLAGGIPIRVPLIDYEVNLDQVNSALGPHTKLIYLCNPNNPTGRFIPFDCLQRFVMGLPSHVITVVDEAYYEFVEDSSYKSAVELIGTTPGPLIIIRTFSKIHALASLRVGYGLAEPEVIQILDRARQPFNVNAIAQVAALASLSDEAYIQESRQLVWNERRRVYHALRAMSDQGIHPISSQANFILVDCASNTDSLWYELVRRGVIVRKGSDVGFSTALRVTIGLPEENDQFLHAFHEVLPGWHK